MLWAGRSGFTWGFLAGWGFLGSAQEEEGQLGQQGVSCVWRCLGRFGCVGRPEAPVLKGIWAPLAPKPGPERWHPALLGLPAQSAGSVLG